MRIHVTVQQCGENVKLELKQIAAKLCKISLLKKNYAWISEP